MEFINENEVVIADNSGNFTIANNILEPEKTQICIIETKCEKFKDIKILPNKQALASISNDGRICIWKIDNLR